MKYRAVLVLITFIFSEIAWTADSDLPVPQDLNALTELLLPLNGPGFKGQLNYKAEKSEYLFSLDIAKSKKGFKYKILLEQDCSKTSVKNDDSFQVGSFTGVKEKLLTEFYLNRYQIENAEGVMKYKYLKISEDHGRSKSVAVSCVRLAETSHE